ncbi:MAG TPA: hypothetical protein VJV04_03745 [Nitrospiraceae bacterium]|nr:hypothetical protein [Nitrospiraceae bacterium]
MAPPALPPESEPVLPPVKTIQELIRQRLFEEPTLLPPSFIDASYRALEQWKKDHHIPITIGAHNWFHLNNGGPHATGYGIPGLNGTYFYYLLADPAFYAGPLADKAGIHVEARFRDGNTPFRAYFPATNAYFYEAYGWLQTPFGRLKGGAVVRRFGIDWDGSWWGNVQYFDGLKLNPDLGVSLEDTHDFRNGLKVDRFVQFFVKDYNVSGSIVGANPESVVGSRQVNTLMARVVPTWSFRDHSAVALGLSGYVGEIRNDPGIYVIGQPVLRQTGTAGSPAPTGGKESVGAWAVDLSYFNGGLRVFGEFDQLYGTLSPSRYVSGGPSNRTTDVLVGFNYKRGPITYTFSYSAGFDSNPSGTQRLWVPGGVVALTSNVDMYVNYVFWQVRQHGMSQFVTFENGVQSVFVWRY